MRQTIAVDVQVARRGLAGPGHLISDTNTMGHATPSLALAAARQWLKPAILVLLRCGVAWREFAELAKSVYVEVASEHFGRRGRPTNVSRTAMLTGLARREVRRQREAIGRGDPALSGYVSKASLVLSTWHLDAQFRDARGAPRRLPLEGEHASFAALLRRCGAGDVPASTLLKELINAGAVRQRADGSLLAVKRNYIPQDLDAEMVRLWGSILADIATTTAHNLSSQTREPKRFERAAVNDRIRRSALPEFRQFIEREGQALLERVDAWLLAHQQPAGEPDPSEGTLRLGAGVYHIQD